MSGAFISDFYIKSIYWHRKQIEHEEIFRPKVQSILFSAQAALQKIAITRPPKPGVKMRLVTKFELVAKNESKLHALLRNTFNEFARSEANTHQRLASIENIQREIGSSILCP